MAWERLRSTFRRHVPIAWIEAADNDWGVRVLDVRPITLTAQLASSDRQAAINAISFAQDDGTGFIGEEPASARVVEANLRYPVDRLLAPGVLFSPCDMDNLWALFFHRDEVICVDSWHRKVRVVARVETQQDQVSVVAVRGVFWSEDEDSEFTLRVLDYLLRSHALRSVFPAPLPPDLEKSPRNAAGWCMSHFGSLAHYATPHRIAWRDPDRALRTNSLLHIAIARANIPEVEAQLSAGIPIDLLAADGLAPLHWALSPAVMNHLLERGSPVDVRSSEGATPLMTAVQGAALDQVLLLLDHGADVNALDRRGFTALHRAAEMGNVELVEELLNHGALPGIEADGHTALSLAEARGAAKVVAALHTYEGSGNEH